MHLFIPSFDVTVQQKDFLQIINAGLNQVGYLEILFKYLFNFYVSSIRVSKL